MVYNSIILSGTSETDVKSIAARLLQIVENSVSFKPNAVENQSEGDQGDVEYMDESQFNQLCGGKGFLITYEYNNKIYGIRKDIIDIIRGNDVPIIVVKPSAGKEFCRNEIETIEPLTIFFSGGDQNEQGNPRKDYSNYYNYITNADVEDILKMIKLCWDHRMSGGMIPQKMIQHMIKCGLLLKNADLENATGASYDLRLGDEYYQEGRIKILDDHNAFLRIEPYDYAIVSSMEIANLPLDVSGRFDLSVSLFFQGIILSNGTQIDPGFNGKLFCLLFNSSNTSVSIKKSQHYATIEFHKLIHPTQPYEGEHQGENKIIHYLPLNIMRGAIYELKKEVEDLKKQTRDMQSLFLGIASLILAIIALLLLRP